MSYQDGRRVEALEAAVRELREQCEQQLQMLTATMRAVKELQARLNERPALARRHA